jgi:iron(III) transport system ATP-binding protein
VQPDAGEVWFEGRKAKGPAEQLMPGNPGISYLSQQFELPRFLRVEQVLKYANKLSAAEAKQLFEVCRIDHLGERRTDQLSGGEKQRIATARLLITKPQLLLLDEPYSNLDVIHKNILKNVVSDISKRLGITCILTSHDPLDTLPWADEIIVLKEGRIIQQGTPTDIYKHPQNEYVAGLFGKFDLFTKDDSRILSTLNISLKIGATLITRPEDFTIGKEKDSAIEGVVNQIQFFGSYYEIVVLCSGKLITVKAGVVDYTEGDKVYLSLHRQ